jgi:ligand-binding sensor domain-containing protein
VRISLLTLLFLSFLLPQACFSQQQNYSSFTMKDGLPSNMVYRCLEDDEGFLWIATDAGIARFDGKHFQVFTTAHGLPDNEVLAVVKEKDGTIWVNCFKQGPAYFDNIQNRFVKPAAASELSKLPGTYISYMYTLENGGVMYINVNSSQIYTGNFRTIQTGQTCLSW